jgi:uncharacterized hydrophobic protein (TIGR00271 family)
MTETAATLPKATGLAGRLLPLQQRKGVEELREAIDLGYGDTASRQSAFWTMLALSGVIATAGVISNSTATVIGAMIIAPLGTPIMGIAFAVIVAESRTLRRAAAFVFFGMLVVITIGMFGSLLIPASTDLLANPQISGRTSPTLIDMLAAVATGFAGAVGLARRDVSDVLPGVAIAISLVPPLAVVGICIGEQDLALAIGAFLLFASNVLAMVVAGTMMFAAAYLTGPSKMHRDSSKRAYFVIATLFVLILVPLGLNTVGTLLVQTWSDRIQTAADEWLAQTPNAQVLDVEFNSTTATIDVLSPDDLPPTQELLDSLQGQVPSGIEIIIDGAQGERTIAGTVP